MGTAAVEMAVAAGCDVVATVRNPDLRDDVAALGATAVDPASFTDHGPFDVVLELVGAPNIADDLRSLATGGRIAVIGVGAGFRAEVNLLALMGARGRIHGSTLRARPLEEKAAAARRVEHHLLPLLAAGTLTVPIAETFAMSEAPPPTNASRPAGVRQDRARRRLSVARRRPAPARAGAPPSPRRAPPRRR